MTLRCDRRPTIDLRGIWVATPSDLREAGWHNPPEPLLAIWLNGETEFEISDGEIRNPALAAWCSLRILGARATSHAIQSRRTSRSSSSRFRTHISGPPSQQPGWRERPGGAHTGPFQFALPELRRNSTSSPSGLQNGPRKHCCPASYRRCLTRTRRCPSARTL